MHIPALEGCKRNFCFGQRGSSRRWRGILLGKVYDGRLYLIVVHDQWLCEPGAAYNRQRALIRLSFLC